MSGIAKAGVAGVPADTSRLASADNLKNAGDKFESVFTGMMLGAMRKASLADTLFESKALDTFRDMQDQRIAESMATHSPIGIGKAMTEFLGRSQPDLNESPPTPAE
ncbi:rod-binding protein [uncultured Sphingomonas sp.]|uniref:rod-binding protein n=1 Tax=uncultured Sphingomonas sp. TaxID=158754 RepID=UPI0035CAE275